MIMNEAMANACFIVGSRFNGANQITTGTMTHKNRPMKVRQEVLAGADGALIVPASSLRSATTSSANSLACGGSACAFFSMLGSLLGVLFTPTRHLNLARPFKAGKANHQRLHVALRRLKLLRIQLSLRDKIGSSPDPGLERPG